MSIEREWAAATFPPESTVLNLRLRPYSCGHEITLCQAGSPFLIGGREPTFADLMLAALVCSQNFTEGRKIIGSRRDFGMWLWGKMAWRIKDKFAEEQKFIEYLNAGTWSPPTRQDKEPGVSWRELKAPRAYRLIPFLCRNLGMTEAAAMDFPIARANAFYAAECDREGTITLAKGREEATLQKWLEELEARAAKGENVWEF